MTLDLMRHFGTRQRFCCRSAAAPAAGGAAAAGRLEAGAVEARRERVRGR